MRCRICSCESRHEFSQQILGRYECGYFYCLECGFLQTESPYWLEEAYRSAISSADTGLVFRNHYQSKIVSGLLYFIFDRQGKYLDAAGGYGMFTRLMRDMGFNFYWADLYCENLLARGFEGTGTSAPFTAVTAFEVMEHLPEPLRFLRETLAQAQTQTIIFSTELYAEVPPRPEDWWYYSFRTGQHIAFYQERTLRALAAKLGLQVLLEWHDPYVDGPDDLSTIVSCADPSTAKRAHFTVSEACTAIEDDVRQSGNSG